MVTDHGHSKDTHWGAKVLDVEFCSESCFESYCPAGAAAEDENVIDVGIDVGGNVRFQ